MNTAIRITLVVAAVVGVGGGGGLMFLVFQAAAQCAASGVDATPMQVLEAAVLGQAAFVALAYFMLFVGYLFGVRAVVRRRWNVPTKLHHLFIATTLSSVTVVLVGTPFLFAG